MTSKDDRSVVFPGLGPLAMQGKCVNASRSKGGTIDGDRISKS